MANSVVALFDNRSDATSVRDDLVRAGFGPNRIRLVSQPDCSDDAAESSVASAGTGNRSMWEEIKDFFGFGHEADRDQYAQGISHGCTLVAVEAPEDQVDRSIQIMMAHHPVDIEQRAGEWQASDATSGASDASGASGVSAASATASSRNVAPASSATRATPPATNSATAASRTGEQAIPVVEEQLQVGKRQVRERGVRIYTHVTERPVEADVKLRDERVTVERRPVDRPVTDAPRAFEEKAYEVIETHEEPVVSKQARIVEEVVVNKQVQEHTQTVRDTVRRTEVDVQPTGGAAGASSAATTSASADADVRKLYEADAANRTCPYEQWKPAYEFGGQIAADQRYRGRDWNSVETDARTAYQRQNPAGTWEQVKDTVRRAYDGARAKV